MADLVTISIPIWFPVVCAFGASICRGLTGFGDGVLFQCLWAMLSLVTPSFLSPVEVPPDSITNMQGGPAFDMAWNSTVGAYSAADAEAIVIRKSVLFSSMMQVLTMPVILFVARAHIPPILGYVGVMACIGSLNVVVGAYLLLQANVVALKAVVGALFLLSSMGQLTGSIVPAILKKHKDRPATTAASSTSDSPTAEHADDPHAHHADSHELAPLHANGKEQVADLTSLVATQEPSHVDVVVAAETLPLPANDKETNTPSPSPSSASASPAVAKVRPDVADDTWFDRWFPRLSSRMRPKNMLIVLSLACVLSGLLSGMFGTGGPPLMLSYAMLELDKNVLRGFSLLGCIFMFIRMGMYLGGEGNVFTLGDWPVYVGIWVAASLGATLGTFLRKYCNSTVITRILLLLVFLSSALLLGALKNPAMAAFYGILAVVWAAGLLLLHRYAVQVTAGCKVLQARCRARQPQ